MKTLIYTPIGISLILLLFSCKTTNVEKDATVEYILLVGKTETIAVGTSKYSIQRQYVYDTLSAQPTLKQEIIGNEISEYSYPSDAKVVVKSIDKTTKKVENTATYTLDPNTRNVLSQIDDFGIESKFSYNTEGYLTKSDFQEGTTYEYTAGNLSKTTIKYDDNGYVEEFGYGSDLLKTPLAPFFYGKPNKNILIKKVSTSTIPNTPPTTVTETIVTTLNAQGYPLTERINLAGGGYTETKNQYQILKK
jgi:hypothetical protein